MKKIAVGAIAIIALATTLALQSASVQDALFEREISARLQHDSFRDTGFHVFFCGTGSPLPSLTRAQNCTAIAVNGRLFLIDAGTGSWENIQNAGYNGAALEAIFVTHFHTDHIGDLGEANLGSWVAGREGRLPVFGPTGIDDVVDGLNTAFSHDNEYRTAHHGKAVAPPRSAGMVAQNFAGDEETIVYQNDGVVVRAFPVSHEPVSPSVGYQFEFDDVSIVVSGDTARSSSLIKAARGADLLIHEAQANHMIERIGAAAAKRGDVRLAKIMSDVPSYHTSPVEAAEIANEAGVKILALSHLNPAPDNWITKNIFMRGVKKVRKKVIVAEDGMTILFDDDSVRVRRR